MNSPNLLFKLIPVPGTDWVGNVIIRCLETGLVAELSYTSQSFFGFRGNRRQIKGKIFDSLSMKILYKIDGHWDRYLTLLIFYVKKNSDCHLFICLPIIFR